MLTHLNANSCSFSQSVQPSKNPGSMFFSPTDRKEVLQVINCLSNSSTPDFFGISNKLLRTVSSYVCEPIVHIANLSMTNGVFPEIFKSAIVIPIHKNGDPSEISNYRPISLLPVTSKVGKIGNRLFEYPRKTYCRSKLISRNTEIPGFKCQC